MLVLSGRALALPCIGESHKQRGEILRLAQVTHSVSNNGRLRVTHLARSVQTQLLTHTKHVIKLSETGGDSGGKIHNLQNAGVVCGGALPVNRSAVSHPRDNQALHDLQHCALRKEASHVAETNQEADILSHHVTDVGVPSEMTVKQDTQVLTR